MRSFQMIFLLLFVLFYAIINFAALKNLIQSFSRKWKKQITWIFCIYSLFLIGTFVFLYIYPYNPRHAHNYTVYLYFNAGLFTDFVIKLILAFSFLLYFPFRKKAAAQTILMAGIIIGIGTGLTMIYGTWLGKRNLKITNVELKYDRLPPSFDNYKIVQISDLHLGSFLHSTGLLEKTKSKIKEINPDLLLFTGDLVNNFGKETVGWKTILNQINTGYPSYSILGNHDYGDYTDWNSKNEKENNFEEILEAHREMGFHLLRNEHIFIRLKRDTIYLAGVENWGKPPFPQLANLNKALKGIPQNAFKILMTHDPSHWEKEIKGKRDIDLTLSGHTHGLQWGIKTAGIPFSLAYLIEKYWGGLYQSNNNYLYVNTGLGTVGIPWRIDMNPEITVFTLKRRE